MSMPAKILSLKVPSVGFGVWYESQDQVLAYQKRADSYKRMTVLKGKLCSALSFSSLAKDYHHEPHWTTSFWRSWSSRQQCCSYDYWIATTLRVPKESPWISRGKACQTSSLEWILWQEPFQLYEFYCRNHQALEVSLIQRKEEEKVNWLLWIVTTCSILLSIICSLFLDWPSMQCKYRTSCKEASMTELLVGLQTGHCYLPLHSSLEDSFSFHAWMVHWLLGIPAYHLQLYMVLIVVHLLFYSSSLVLQVPSFG